MRKAFDPLVLHTLDAVLRNRARGRTLSFGESLDGTRDILIVAARHLTDLLGIVPAAAALRQRFRLARVHVLASNSCAAALEGRSEIFSVVPLPDDRTPLLTREFFELVRDLRRLPFDLAVCTDDGSDRRGRLLAALAGARLRVGVHPGGQDPALNLVVSWGGGEGYRPVQSLEFLSFLGMARDRLAPGWDVPPTDRQYAKRLLDLRRRGREGWLLGVDPGAGLGNSHPHPEKLAWIVNRLVANRGALPIILTETPEDPGVAQFKSYLNSPPLEVASRGFRDVLAFGTCCDVVLGGNTSFLHFAVALDLPAVGLLGRDEDPRWVPTETARRKLLRWQAGDRVSERDVLEVVDSVRRSRVVEMPLLIEPVLEVEDPASSGADADEVGASERSARRA
ncbi:MAG: hypothetical protein R3B81_10720 [bacterium]